MADNDDHDVPEIDNREQDADRANSLAVPEEPIAYEPTSTTTTLNDGQSRRILQADRLDRSDVHTSMLQPYVYCARMHVETDKGMVEHPASDGLFEPEMMENQQPQAVDVIRGAVSFASYPPAVKTPLTVHDYCRVFDTVVTTGGVLKGRPEHNLVGAVVLYPGRCLNQTAPIETDLKTPLPPLPKCNVDTAGAMAIVGWFSPLDEKSPLSQLVIKPTSYAYAAVRVVAIKIGDLVEHLQQQIVHLTAQLTALDAKRASSPTPGLVALDIQAALAAKQNMVARVAAIEARNYKFTGISADVGDTKIKPSAHMSRRVMLYVYDVVDELRQRALELLRPTIDWFDAARDAHARRLWAAPNRNGEAIGLRVECLGSTDGKFPRFVTMIMLPNIPISPVLAALPETARGCDVTTLDKTTSVGTSATDIVVIDGVYTSLLKRTPMANGDKLNKAPPTVVIAAPTKKAMTSTSAETTDSILAALTKNVGDITTKRLGEQYVKAKRKVEVDAESASTKRAKGAAAKPADGESSTATKSDADANGVETVGKASLSIAATKSDIDTNGVEPVAKSATSQPIATSSAPAAKTSAAPPSDDGRLALPGDTKPMMNTTLLTSHARLAARFDGTTKYLAKMAPGFGPIGRVTTDTDRLTSAQREQMASAAQFLQMFGLLEQVNALIQQEGTRIEQVEIARVAEEKRKAEEARRAAEEKRRKEEEEAAEKKRQEEAARRAAASVDDEKKRKEERERIAAEKKKRAEELKRQLEQAEAEAREALEF